MVCAEFPDIHPSFLCENIECRFCRVPDHLAILDIGIDTECTGKEDKIKIFFRVAHRPLDLSLGAVSFPGHHVTVFYGGYCPDRHLVHRERPGLV